MLREFNRIAREMLFLHGHLTRPRDWAENAPADLNPGSGRGERKLTRKGSGSSRITATAAVCGVVLPTRLIVGQFR
ncbi:MAG TPA: hypothetical protein VGO25_11460 [Rhodanobacteraceae bacterium]|nr:hypothetical protein [Rhodanobacteraceae bacterium]